MITLEVALIEWPRICGIVLIDAVGIDVAGPPVADFFTVGYDEFLERAFRNPDPFRSIPARCASSEVPPTASTIG